GSPTRRNARGARYPWSSCCSPTRSACPARTAPAAPVLPTAQTARPTQATRTTQTTQAQEGDPDAPLPARADDECTLRRTAPREHPEPRRRGPGRAPPPAAAAPGSCCTPPRRPAKATTAATAMIAAITYSTVWIDWAKSTRKKCGIDATLPLPAWDCDRLAASAAARPLGRPRATSDEVTWLRTWVTRIVPRMARPRLAA